MSESVNNQHTCKNCNNHFTGKYCNNCGEKVYTPHDNTMLHLIEESTHFITHFDGSFFNTLKAIFTQPGRLSLDYCNGIRKKYFKPVSFFLLLVVIYLLFPVFEGLNQRLTYHMHSTFYGGYATRKIEHIMQNTGLTLQQVEEEFHVKGEKVSKFLLLIIIPVTAILLQLFTFKKRRLFFDQVIFGTEINIIFILFGFLLLPLVLTVWLHVTKLVAGKEIYLADTIIGMVLLITIIIYVVFAAKRFYSLKLTRAILLSISVVGLEILFVQFIYKFILFQIISWQLH